ncbi:MAG: ADP-ribosylglycohydrolase family protein [Desulforhopalus sp.]
MKTSAQAMLIGSFVADSLALGVHWVYDTEEIIRNYSTVKTLLPPHQKSYHPTKDGGDFTHYGDQALHLLEYLSKRGGEFSPADYAAEWQKYIAVYDGYLDRASRDTLGNMEEGVHKVDCGSMSSDLGGPARIAPLIYCYRHNLDGLLQAVSDYCALTHCGMGISDGALFLARSCYSILHGASPRKAFEKAMAFTFEDLKLDLRLRSSLEMQNLNVIEVTKNFGQMCAINAALPGAVYTILDNEKNYERALTETVMSGGDSAARGMVVGMMLGAHLGPDTIPPAWWSNMNARTQIQKSIDNLP